MYFIFNKPHMHPFQRKITHEQFFFFISLKKLKFIFIQIVTKILFINIFSKNNEIQEKISKN